MSIYTTSQMVASNALIRMAHVCALEGLTATYEGLCCLLYILGMQAVWYLQEGTYRSIGRKKDFTLVYYQTVF